MDDDALLTRAAVAALFGVDRATVRRWTDAGLLPAVTTGSGLRYWRSAVLALREERTQPRTDNPQPQVETLFEQPSTSG